MIATPLLTAEFVREILRYDPTTGDFYWVAPRAPQVPVGSLAGANSSDGYRQISISGRLYRAHRLAWLYVHGVWPSKIIDHIDGDKKNNALSNLRDISHSENSKHYHAEKFTWRAAPAFHF